MKKLALPPQYPNVRVAAQHHYNTRIKLSKNINEEHESPPTIS